MPSDKWLSTRKQVKFYLTEQEYEAFKAECAKHDITMADALRAGVTWLLSKALTPSEQFIAGWKLGQTLEHAGEDTPVGSQDDRQAARQVRTHTQDD
jgi:hypothetical protein